MKDKSFTSLVKENYADDLASNILSAYDFLKKSLAGNSQEAYYFNHAVNTASLIIDFGLDWQTVTVALIHDLVLLGLTNNKSIKTEFGEDIENLVKLYEKISQMQFIRSTDANQELENIRQMFLALGKDIRVILIKICERYDELLSLETFPPEKQFSLASETMDIFVPLVERLGMGELRAKMEDICFKYLQPNEYKLLQADLEKKFDKRTNIMAEIEKELKQSLVKLEIKGEVTSRFKHLYSVYKKLKKAGTEKIYDIIAFRVLVNSVRECYAVLGEIHSIYRPVPGRIKDYIASPKPNGYQSLHTTLLTHDGVPFEVQIRTHQMHEYCEYGIAAHWRYKEGKTKEDNLEERINWFKRTLESEKQIKDNEKFIDALKMNLATGEIWVFTPKYKPINLPEHSTPVDFAYAIHSNIGNKCVGAKVNDKMVPLSTELVTGDVVEIITAAQSKGPSLDWLNFTRSSNARQQIRTFFKKQSRETNIKSGREILELEAKKCGYQLGDLLSEINLEEFTKRFNVSSLDDLFASIGFGGITAKQALGKVVSERKEKEKIQRQITLAEAPVSQKAHNPNAVIVDGHKGLEVKFGHCCNPIAGDDIVGFSSSRGITIHKVDCPNIKLIKEEKRCQVSWDNLALSSFVYKLALIVESAAPVLSQVTPLLAKLKVTIISINSRPITSGESELILGVEVKNRAQVEDIKKKMMSLNGVIDVK